MMWRNLHLRGSASWCSEGDVCQCAWRGRSGRGPLKQTARASNGDGGGGSEGTAAGLGARRRGTWAMLGMRIAGAPRLRPAPGADIAVGRARAKENCE